MTLAKLIIDIIF